MKTAHSDVVRTLRLSQGQVHKLKVTKIACEPQFCSHTLSSGPSASCLEAVGKFIEHQFTTGIARLCRKLPPPFHSEDLAQTSWSSCEDGCLQGIEKASHGMCLCI